MLPVLYESLIGNQVVAENKTIKGDKFRDYSRQCYRPQGSHRDIVEVQKRYGAEKDICYEYSPAGNILTLNKQSPYR